MKNQTKENIIDIVGVCLICLLALIPFAITATFVYIIIHFIAKFW